MSDRELEDLTALLPPLLDSLEKLGFVARHLHPPAFGELMAAVGAPETPLRALRPRLDDWSGALVHVRDPLAAAVDAAIAGWDELRAAQEDPDGLAVVFRALRHLPRAQEALYPLAYDLPPLSRYFLEPEQRGDGARMAALANAPRRQDTGVMHSADPPGERGGFSMYVPEDYEPGRAMPLVFALHGGSGNGRAFLWSWVRAARGAGAIVVAPTAVGRTWAITGDDADTPNLAAILDFVRSRWTIDPQRILLSGMSDGGTFSYVSGLEPRSPFTHLAPTSAAFHPMLAHFADGDRLRGLPIQITHGALDWMFPVSMAREARDALSGAGADVAYVELDDLSHTWPRELGLPTLAWLAR